MLNLTARNPRTALTVGGVTEEKDFDMDKYKTCSVCGQNKTFDDFGFQNKAQNRYKSQCKKCDTARMAAYNKRNKAKISVQKQRYYIENRDTKLLQSRLYRSNNKDAVREANKRWVEQNLEHVRLLAKNRKAMRKASSSFLVTAKDLKKIRTQPCSYCGASKAEHIDHVIPLIRGGKHSIGNLTAACQKCNLSKNKWFVTEWKLKMKKWGQSF